MEVIAITAASMMAFSMIRGGYGEKEAYRFQAEAAEREAQGMRNQAEFERGQAEMSRVEALQEKLKGDVAMREHEKKSSALLGDFVARTASRGVKLTGSPLEYLASTAEDLAFERQMTGYESDINAWRKTREGAIHLEKAKLLDAEAPMLMAKAGAYRSMGRDAVVSGWMKGLGTLGMAGYSIYGKPPIAAGTQDSTSAALKGGW